MGNVQTYENQIRHHDTQSGEGVEHETENKCKTRLWIIGTKTQNIEKPTAT